MLPVPSCLFSLASLPTEKTYFVHDGHLTPRGHGIVAKALLALVESGPKGVTALEAATWAYRFAAYCFDLRRKHELAIRTDKENHPGGWHGRHVLESDVRIEEDGAEGEAK